MEFVSIILACIVGVLVIIASFTILYRIVKSIKTQVDFKNKYKSSFTKYFHKLKVPIIKLKIGGDLRYFLIDSGAESNVLDKAIFEKLPKNSFTKLSEASDITSIAGNAVETFKISTNLSYKKEVYDNVEFNIVDLANVIEVVKSKSNINIVGILGSSFFSTYKWLIDFDERCIWISQNKTNNE